MTPFLIFSQYQTLLFINPEYNMYIALYIAPFLQKKNVLTIVYLYFIFLLYSNLNKERTYAFLVALGYFST